MKEQGAPAIEQKDEDSYSDDGSLSENEESSFSVKDNSNNHPLLLELAALRSKMAPLLGRTSPTVIDQVSEALEKFPDQAQWYFSRGMVNAKLEKFDQAIQDLTVAAELASSIDQDNNKAIGENASETICIAYLNRARARSDLGDVKGALNDAKLAVEHASSSSSSISNLKTESRNAHALFQQKLQKQKELLSSEPDIVHHGSGIVIEDVTEEHAKISAKKAGVIAAVRIAKGRQQAEVGREFRTQFNEKVKLYEEEAKEKRKKEKKKERKKKRNAQKAAEKKAAEEAAAAAAVAAAAVAEKEPSPSCIKLEEKKEEEYMKLYKVETFPDPQDPDITIERIHIPITFVEVNAKQPVAPFCEEKKKLAKDDGCLDSSSPSSTGSSEMKVGQGMVPGLSVGSLDESKFDFLKRYNF